jgi:parallel beta-helix repeat protein
VFVKNSLISVIFFSLLLIGSLGPTLKTRFFAESGSSVYETDLAKAALFLNSTQFDPMVGLCREAPIVHNTTYWLVSDNLLAYHALEYYYPETASVIYATMLGYGYFRSYKHEVVFGTTVPYIPFENATSLNVTQIGTKSVETEVDNGLPSINDTEHEDLCIYEALDYYWNGNTSQAIVSFNLAKSMWDGVGIHEPGFNGSYETYKLALLLYASRIIGQPLANQTGVEEVLWMMQDPNNGGLHTNYDVNFNYSGSDVNTETTSLAILAYRYTPAIVNRSGQNPPPLDVPPDFLTIQEAINHAKEGDTVYLFSGTYNEKVVVNVTVSLTGEDEDSTIIDGNGTGTVVTIGANFVSLSNLTIRNPGTVWVQGSWYIESCIQGSYLTNVTVKDVTCIGGAVPVWFDHSSCVNISDDAVTGGEYLGIGGYTLQNITICHNHVFNCTSTDGIHLDGGSRYCTVTNNTVTDCFDGITLETNDYSPWPTSDNLIDGNSIENITLASIGLFKCGTNVFRRNNMTGKQNNLVVWGSGPEAFVQDIDTSNTANGRVLYYLTNKSDLTIDPTDCPNAGDVVSQTAPTQRSETSTSVTAWTAYCWPARKTALS